MTTSDWETTRSAFLRRWPGLTSDELDATGGQRDELAALLQLRMGYASENAAADVEEMLSGNTIEPRDVATESTHTGSDGPVPNTQVPSGLTSFYSEEDERRAAGEPVGADAESAPAGGQTEGGRNAEQPRDRSAPTVETSAGFLTRLFDGLDVRLQRTLGSMFRSGSLHRLEPTLRGRWLGHPLHSALTDIVVGSWTLSCLFDALSMLGVKRLGAATNVAMAAGLVATPLVAAAGAADWRHQNEPLRAVGLRHMMLNSLATICYGGSLACRLKQLPGWGRVLSIVGFGIAAWSAGLGGSMAYSKDLRIAASDDRLESALGSEISRGI